ncbi:MAG: ATP-binding protein [Solobacterium sp.]|nr:ATP-binding protein [Solobacterium sp.]
MRFIGRVKEQDAIAYLTSQSDYRGCIVYGRRRLGKTELLKHCLLNRDAPCIFFQCLQDSEQANVEALTRTTQQVLGLSHLHFESFPELISYIFEYSCTKEVYLVLDEYPYVRRTVSGMDSRLQAIIDRYQSSSKLKFFLTGSSIATMENILSADNPLYRRFHLQLLIKEMDYLDSSEFYHSFSEEDKVRCYAAFGGVPFYNQQIDSTRSVKENIIRLLSGEFSHLEDDITINLKEELSKISNASAVFSAIAEGAFHFSDILSKSHINSSASLSDVLEKLLKMDLIEYISPINDHKNKMKSGYRIADSSVQFYYQYIYRYKSARAILSDETFYQNYISDHFENAHVPKKFEKIAMQYLIRLNRSGKLNPLLTDIGTYWYDVPSENRNGQFDIVGKCDGGYVFYEVKYTKSPVTDEIINEEIKQVSRTTLRPVGYGFFSRSGFKISDNTHYQLVTLQDIYHLD